MESEFTVLFRGPNGSLQIVIEGYQFPAVSDDWWDANWLIVRGNVSVDGLSWEFRDACLTTFELERLAAWLDGVADEKEATTIFRFIEPNLEFRVNANGTVRVAISLEALPPWANPSVGKAMIDVPINSGLADVAAGLRRNLNNFPVRTPGTVSSGTSA